MKHTNSEIGVYVGCKFLWFLKYLLLLTPKGIGPKALVIGTLWHKMMEIVYNHGNVIESIPDLSVLVSKEEQRYHNLVAQQDLFQRNMWTHNQVVDMFYMLQSMVSNYKPIKHDALVLNERYLESEYFAGIPDKLVLINGSYWIVEHKTSSKDLLGWRKENGKKPQAIRYAILIRDVTGIEVEGVIYDLVRKTTPPTMDKFKLTKAGKLHKRLPAGTTVDSLRNAIRHHKLDPMDYVDQIETLSKKGPMLYHRVKVRFTYSEIERTEKELKHIVQQMNNDPLTLAPTIPGCDTLDLIKSYGHLYTRNPSHCMRYNRLCTFYDLCTYQSEEALSDFYIRDHYHPETQENQ